MKILVLSCLTLFLFLSNSTFAQCNGHLPPGKIPPPSAPSAPVILRHYPESGAREVPTVTQIGITAQSSYGPGVTNPQAWRVEGARSGLHTGRSHLSNDNCTAIFVPDIPFDTDEAVSVALLSPQSPICQFSFTTTVLEPESFVKNPPPFIDNALLSKTKPRITDRALDEFFNVTEDNNPMPGLIFISPFGPTDMGEIMITDEHGNVFFDLPVPASDFVLQPNGEYTYFGQPNSYFGIDTTGTMLHIYTCANGIQTDGHEFAIQQDGSYYMLGLSSTSQDMSASGGSKSARIQGGVIQSFDSSGNLVFEWRGIDHYKVTDDIIPGDLLIQNIDFEHANSIDVDADGNYLLSNRNLSEITKINAQNGAIMWRFGGKNNQFKLIGDTLGISCQHFARYVDNGDILMFDNGVYHANPESRAVQYRLDTIAMTATLTWQYHHNPPLFADVMGDAERLDNGNTFIGWGDNFTESATEVDSNGNVVYEAQLPGSDNSYRALKYPYTVGTTSQNSSVAAVPSSAAGLTIEKTSQGYDLTVDAPNAENISLTLYDETGRTMRDLFNGTVPSGSSHFTFSSSSFTSGAYFCVLRTSGSVVTKPVYISQ